MSELVPTTFIVTCPKCGRRWDVTNLQQGLPIRCDCRALIKPQPGGGVAWVWSNAWGETDHE